MQKGEPRKQGIYHIYIPVDEGTATRTYFQK